MSAFVVPSFADPHGMLDVMQYHSGQTCHLKYRAAQTCHSPSFKRAAHGERHGCLQERYRSLQDMYKSLKDQKISELEGMLEEQDEYVASMGERAQELAEHWRTEADRQKAFAEAAAAPETQQKMQTLQVRGRN